MKLYYLYRSLYVAIAAVLLSSGPLSAQVDETHANLQAVSNNGASAWSGSFPFRLRGVVLNNPEEMLDATPTQLTNAVAQNIMGGQWQIFIQSTNPADVGGTALWMGQNYNSISPFIPESNGYTIVEWNAEMDRLNILTNGHVLRKGDLIEVLANQSLTFGGKRNVNEAHRITNANDFVITLLEPGYGLPDPEVLGITNVVDDTNAEIFDPARQLGGERYQGVRVRLANVTWSTNGFATNGWGQTSFDDRRCTVTDGAGRTFTLRMPLTDLGDIPEGPFDVIGIGNQEADSFIGTTDYEVFVQEIIPGPALVWRDGDVAWPEPYPGYRLEFTTSMTSDTWTAVSPAATPSNGWFRTAGQSAEDAVYYRLHEDP